MEELIDLLKEKLSTVEEVEVIENGFKLLSEYFEVLVTKGEEKLSITLLGMSSCGEVKNTLELPIYIDYEVIPSILTFNIKFLGIKSRIPTSEEKAEAEKIRKSKLKEFVAFLVQEYDKSIQEFKEKNGPKELYDFIEKYGETDYVNQMRAPYMKVGKWLIDFRSYYNNRVSLYKERELSFPDTHDNDDKKPSNLILVDYEDRELEKLANQKILGDSLYMNFSPKCNYKNIPYYGDEDLLEKKLSEFLERQDDDSR